MAVARRNFKSGFYFRLTPGRQVTRHCLLSRAIKIREHYLTFITALPVIQIGFVLGLTLIPWPLLIS